MNKNLVILGAGPGTGLSLARSYGERGYRVLLVARRQDALDALVAGLTAESVEAHGFVADVTDLSALRAVLRAISERFDSIDALAFSPSSATGFTAAADLTVDIARPYFDLFTYPLIEAIDVVLPGMLERGDGEIIYVNGASALGAPPKMSGPAPAMAAARNYLETLRAEVADRGVRVRAVFVAALIEDTAGFLEATKWSANGDFPSIAPALIAAEAADLLAQDSAFEAVLPRR